MITDPRIEAYLLDLAPTHDAVQADMERLAATRGFPIVGPLVGRLLMQVARSVGARDIFEMGSGFGYSTLFFARAMDDSGRVVHTDLDPKLSAEARQLLGRAGLASRVTFEVGDALEVITRYAGPFDVVFIDVEKVDYPAALDLARVRVRPGGFIITDNVLWRGKVADAPETYDAETRAVDAYNRSAFAAPDLLTTILPLRDGVALHYKTGETPRRTRPSSPRLMAPTPRSLHPSITIKKK
ncbi:MAG: O-methyltransferase [Myxococcales bacterium]|nr:O-methyltransferase [Myxococcales bacterium]